MNLTLSEIFDHGGGAMWIILAFSIIALAVAVERFFTLWRVVGHARVLAGNVTRALGRAGLPDARAQNERSSSPLADVFAVGFERAGGKRAHLAAAVHRQRARVTAALRARLWLLATVGATAPFVGLFGTVVGIMDAMGQFDTSTNVTFGLVAGPISMALIVTAAGILVAVEAVILFNYFNQRVGAIGAEFKLLTDEFLEELGDAIDAGGDMDKAPEPERPAAKAKAKGKGAEAADATAEAPDGDR
jgi:biopolymer transport protein ExbB/TolQ